MSKAIFCKATDEGSISIIETLAKEIWIECYTPINGKAHVEYMIDKFQSKEAILNQLKDGFEYYLIKNQEDYIGYLGVVSKDTHLFLSKIYIKLNKRGSGHGKQAMNFIEKLATENNHPKIALTVNKHNINAIKSYERFGFNIVEAMVMDIGNGYVMDDYKMEKILKVG